MYSNTIRKLGIFLNDQKNRWTIPVSSEVIQKAKQGEWEVFLTESRPVPHNWFPSLQGLDVLCLASGGGQQGPLLAAAGANVTVYDLSDKQLEKDRFVAKRDDLPLKTIQGNMQDLSIFSDEAFDLIFHPVSNIFVPDILTVWRESYRVLCRGGVLLAGLVNPFEYCFDQELIETQQIFQVKYSLPYSDLDSLSEEERIRLFGKNDPVEFSHTLEDQIGGQIDAGFAIIGFYESKREDDPIAKYMPSYIATRAKKI